MAKIVYSIVVGEGNHMPQFDEQLRLIEARSYEEAFMKGRLLGYKKEEKFLNDKMKTVHWQFIDVADIIPLHDLKDGVEVYSRIHETDEAVNYVRYVKESASLLQLNASTAI